MADPTWMQTGRIPVWLRRLLAGRLALLAIAIVLVVLAAMDLTSLLGAALVFVGLVLGIALMPTGDDGDGEAADDSVDSTDSLFPGARRFAESLPDPCFVLAADGAVIHANERAIASFEIRTGNLLPFRLRHPELLAAFAKVTSGAGPQQVQFVERVPTERFFAAWFAALEQTEKRKSYLLILDDLTEARTTERMRADFVANASHELRTPLASLSGFVETLQGAAKDDAQARGRFLEMMHDQAMRMKRLVDDLLSLSRVEMRAHLRPSESVDLLALVRHVVDILMPLARELGVRIESELPQGKVMLTADRDELVQLFSNLIENACKYGHSGERVIVKANAVDGIKGCSAAVVDFGPGIAPEHLPRLTERFYRVDVEQSRRYRGTGLGLAIVKHIVSRHRGRLQIESEPGRGAQFVVHFPDAELAGADNSENTTTDQAVVVS